MSFYISLKQIWREEIYLSLEVLSRLLISNIIELPTKYQKLSFWVKLVNENYHCLCPCKTLILKEQDKTSSNDHTSKMESKLSQVLWLKDLWIHVRTGQGCKVSLRWQLPGFFICVQVQGCSNRHSHGDQFGYHCSSQGTIWTIKSRRKSVA